MKNQGGSYEKVLAILERRGLERRPAQKRERLCMKVHAMNTRMQSVKRNLNVALHRCEPA